jgi:hypothetical protein
MSASKVKREGEGGFPIEFWGFLGFSKDSEEAFRFGTEILLFTTFHSLIKVNDDDDGEVEMFGVVV